MSYTAGMTITEAQQACRTALSTLQQLGHSADAGPLLDAAAEQGVTSYGVIAADTTHSDSWKTQRYAQVYTSILTGLARELAAAADSASTQYSHDCAQVFGTAGLPGDPAVLAISRRDAGERVAQVNDPTALQRLLDQAVRVSDVPFAHAVVEQAILICDADTVTAFTAAFPALADAVDRLWANATRKIATVDITMGWQLASLKPAALDSLMDYEIAAAAAGD